MEFLATHKGQLKKSRLQRMKKLPEPKVYFQYLIHNELYTEFKEQGWIIENLQCLLSNRRRSNIFFISANPLRIIAAMTQGFCTIPLLQYELFYKDDYQLSLLEHYVLKIRHLKNCKSKLIEDFHYLLSRQEKNSSTERGSIGKRTIRSFRPRIASCGQITFGSQMGRFPVDSSSNK